MQRQRLEKHLVICEGEDSLTNFRASAEGQRSVRTFFRDQSAGGHHFLNYYSLST